jgi:hypothetical protein
MERAQTTTIRNNMISQLLQLLVFCARIDQWSQYRFQTIDIRVGQARVHQRRGQIQILAFEGSGLIVVWIAWVPECSCGMDWRRNVGRDVDPIIGVDAEC